jgi:hypothetical protein
MTSLLSRLAGNGAARPYGVQGGAITPADVSKRLADAEASLRVLQLRYGPIAFAADIGDSEAAKALADLNGDIRSTEDRIRALNATLAEAKRLEAMAAEVARENLFHSRRKASEAHMSIFEQAAKDYAEHEAGRTKAWRTMLTEADKIRAACPVPVDGWFTGNELVAFAEFESYRVGGEGMANGMPSITSVPGSRAPSGFENAPDNIPSLSQRVAAACNGLKAVLKTRADSFRGSLND